MKQLYALLIALLLASSAAAQTTKLLIIDGQTKADVVTRFGLENTDSTTEAAENVTDLQTQLTANNFLYPWYFPVSHTVSGSTRTPTAWYGNELSAPVTIPASSGVRWEGAGPASPNGGTGLTSLGSFLQMKSSVNRTDFDGTTNKLTSSGSGTTCIVTGRATVATDQYCSVYISGGTNATAGWYGIASVTPGASGTGTWTLDRSWCSGAVTDGAGSYCPELIHDSSFKSFYRGLTFMGRRQPDGSGESGTAADALFHCLTNDISGGCPTGKQVFENCAFGFAKTAILHGRYMVGYDATTTTWTGSDDDHADHCTDRDCFFTDLVNVHTTNNVQSVCHTSYNAHCQNITNSFMQLNAGGRNAIYNLSIAGNSGSQWIFDVGPGYAGVEDECNVFGGHTDRNNCRNPGLIKTRWTGIDRIGTFNFYGYKISRNSTNDSQPVIDIQSQCNVRVCNCMFSTGSSRGLWANSVRLKNGSGANYKPRVSFYGLLLGSGVTADDIFFECDNGIYVDFYATTDLNPAKVPDQTYLTGTGFVEWDGDSWELIP